MSFDGILQNDYVNIISSSILFQIQYEGNIYWAPKGDAKCKLQLFSLSRMFALFVWTNANT